MSCGDPRDFHSPLQSDGQIQIIDVDAMRGVVHVGFSCGHEAVLSVEPDKDHIVVHDGMCPVCNAKPVFKPITDLHHGRDVRGPKPLGGWPKIEIGVANESGRDIEKGEVFELAGKAVREALEAVWGHGDERDYQKYAAIDGQQVAAVFSHGHECAHDWVDVGFHFSKFVCSKCDAVKP